MTPHTVSRRTFLAISAALPFALRTSAASSIPIGLELYSVRNELKRDQQATVRAVAKMGYQCVEFFAPYYAWSEDETKQIRKLMDDLGIRCYSTHNDSSNVNAENIAKTIDRNLILGCKYAVVASSHPQPTTLDGWKTVADALNSADEQLAKSGLHAGYHNHEPEFTPIDGGRPMEVIAKNTRPSIMLQLDVGTCLKAGSDPVAWIRSNPGRIRSLHLKEWSSDPAKAYSVLFGEGNADWKGILAAAESVGGVEYYLIEQEGSRFSELETAERCLKAYRAVHPS
ncbi:MAG TPA: sugar phosphate isomerase/epimerase family protein [Candidatus Acidoferrum sp.]|nr:sugar phosphate isomerase/epimerase family protein [Candidatus Acidoferrum sp.]